MTTVPTGYITFEQFLADASIPEHSEWVDGTVVPMHAVAEPHDRIVGWLSDLFGPYVRRRRLGRLLHDPFCMFLPSAKSGRCPDLFFVATAHLDRVVAKHLHGPADLVIEVISPESRTRDRVKKFGEYERGGVSEYWLIDPVPGIAEFYRLNPERQFVPVDPDAGIHTTPLWPEVRFDTAWLKQNPLPDPFDIWAQWGVR